MADKFTLYERTALIQQMRTMFLYTEHSGSTAKFYSFSFAGGDSGYSFGLIQFDVKTNSTASHFLKTIGFTDDEINQLQGHSPINNLSNLNAKLLANKRAIDELMGEELNKKIDKLEALLDEVEMVRPDVAASIRGNVEMQLRVLDFDNQFNIEGITGFDRKPDGLFLKYLKGNSVSLALDTVELLSWGGLDASDIQDFISATKQARDTPKDIIRRSGDLEKALKKLDLISLDGGDGAEAPNGNNPIGLNGNSQLDDIFNADSNSLGLLIVRASYTEQSGTINTVKSNLEALGYSVTAADTFLIAKRGDEFMVIGNGTLTIGKGDKAITLELQSDKIVVTAVELIGFIDSKTTVRNYTLQGQLTDTAVITTNGITTNTIYKDATGNVTSNKSVQTYDDGSSLEVTTLPSGQITTRAFDDNQRLTSAITTTPLSGTTLTQTATTNYSGGQPTPTQYDVKKPDGTVVASGDGPAVVNPNGTITLPAEGGGSATYSSGTNPTLLVVRSSSGDGFMVDSNGVNIPISAGTVVSITGGQIKNVSTPLEGGGEVKLIFGAGNIYLGTSTTVPTAAGSDTVLQDTRGNTLSTTQTQLDASNNLLSITTAANGQGTIQITDSQGRLVGTANFQRLDDNGQPSAYGESGTITAIVGGKAVTYSATFEGDFGRSGAAGADGSGTGSDGNSAVTTSLEKMGITGVLAINGQLLNASATAAVNQSMDDAALDGTDLFAFGAVTGTGSFATLQASLDLQQYTATANPALTGQSQFVPVPVAAAGNPSALDQLNGWAKDHADFTQGLNGAMTLLRGLQTNNKISITTGAFDLAKSFASAGAGRPHGDWLSGQCVLDAANDGAWRFVA
jgi:hypothetical protein